MILWSTITATAVLLHHRIMGGKRNKAKKAAPAPPSSIQEDDQLMDSLFSELDARDQSEEIVLVPNPTESAQKVTKKQDSKARHLARQVRCDYQCNGPVLHIHPRLEKRLP